MFVDMIFLNIAFVDIIFLNIVLVDMMQVRQMYVTMSGFFVHMEMAVLTMAEILMAMGVMTVAVPVPVLVGKGGVAMGMLMFF